MTYKTVCSVDELSAGERIIREINGSEIAVFNVEGEYIAVLNYCVHQAGPVCEGAVSGTTTADPDEWEYDWGLEGRVINCPWHGWEFDLLSGKNLANDEYRLVTYDVTVENGEIKVDV